MKSIQVRVRIPVALLPRIDEIRLATGLSYPGEVLLLVFQWFLADAPRDKETTHGDVRDPASSVAPKEVEARIRVQEGSLRDFMRSLAG